MKRLFTFTLALSMLLTLLAGCGGDDSKTPDAANSPPPAISPAAAALPEMT